MVFGQTLFCTFCPSRSTLANFENSLPNFGILVCKPLDQMQFDGFWRLLKSPSYQIHSPTAKRKFRFRIF